MKVLILFIFSSMFSLSAHARAQAGTAGTIGDAQQVMQNALQEIARTDPEVKQKLSNCYDQYQAAPDNDKPNVSNCLWNGLSQEKKDQITEAVREFNDQSKGNTVGVNLRNQTQQDGSVNQEALDVLGKFYGDRLEEELGTKGKSFGVNDQSIYFELAKTQIGKNVMTAWSSFCIDATWTVNTSTAFSGSGDSTNLKLFIPKNKAQRERVRKQNLLGLKNINSSAEILYSLCTSHIVLLCREAEGIPKIFSAANLENGNPNTMRKKVNYRSYSHEDVDNTVFSFLGTPINISYGNDEDGEKDSSIEYTRQRACETLAYTDTLRKQLSITEKVAKTFDEGMAADGAKRTGIALSNHELKQEQVDFDRATTVTSGDLQNDESNYYDAVAGSADRLAPCRGPNPDLNDENCKALLAEGDQVESLRENGTALMLETAAINQEINNATDEDSKRALLKRLRPELGDEAEIDELRGQALENEFTKLKDQYGNERAALIASLSERVDQLTRVSDDQTNKNRAKAAANSILSRGNEYVQLMHFNNIVTGFLTVTTGSGADEEKSPNTRVLNLELESIAVTGGSGNGAISGIFDEESNRELTDEITRNNDGAGAGAGSNPSNIVTFGSEDIAKFNDYVIE